MDKFEKLISDSTFAAAILGNLETATFELVPLTGGTPVDPPALHAERVARGFCFRRHARLLWTAAFCSVALAEPLADDAIAMIAEGFSQLVVCSRIRRTALDRLRAKLAKDDSADWLARLHSLPDTRSN